MAAAAGFERELVHLSDGSSVDPDVVMFATGYKRGLTSSLEGLVMTDESAVPRVRSGQAAAPGFYFVGFTVSATGALRQMSADARRVARSEEDRVRSRCKVRNPSAIHRRRHIQWVVMSFDRVLAPVLRSIAAM